VRDLVPVFRQYNIVPEKKLTKAIASIVEMARPGFSAFKKANYQVLLLHLPPNCPKFRV